MTKYVKVAVTTQYNIIRVVKPYRDSWGSAPDPAGGAYSAPPDPLAGFGGPTSKGRGGEGERKGGEGKGGERKGP